MIKLKLNSAERSVAREFADKVSRFLSSVSVFNVSAKIAITGRDLYKITWWYNDGLGAADFVAYIKDRENYENDTLDYDVGGLPIFQRDVIRDKAKIQPDAVMKQWEESGKFKAFCAMYGVKLVKPLHLTEKREELTGSNARAWERATGRKSVSDNFIHFITGYFEYIGEANSVNDKDWIIKCLDQLLRYRKVYRDNKNVRMDKEDADRLYSYVAFDYTTRSKNRFKIQYPGRFYGDPAMPVDNPEETVSVINEMISKYYPDFVGKYRTEIDNGIIYLTVD